MTDMALPLLWHVACSALGNESRRRATLPWLVEAIVPSAMSRVVRDCRGRVAVAQRFVAFRAWLAQPFGAHLLCRSG